MNFKKKIATYHRFDCAHAEGLCVVIDVLRAFTTAAFAFAGGAKEIILVGSIEEAFRRHAENNDLVLIGEKEGDPVEGFHYGNSPAEINKASIKNRRIVQRTSSGTQGVIACRHAPFMLISSFVVAEATLQRIRDINPPSVSFIVTGRKNGDEDYALAEYLERRLLGDNINPTPFLQRVISSPAAQRMLNADTRNYPFGEEDLKLSTHLDRFPFAMEVFKVKDELIAQQSSLVVPEIGEIFS